MGAINTWRVDGLRSLILFGATGRFSLDQYGSGFRWGHSVQHPGDRRLLEDMAPHLMMAVQNVKDVTGKHRFGRKGSFERQEFLTAVLLVATALKRGDDPQTVRCNYLGTSRPLFYAAPENAELCDERPF